MEEIHEKYLSLGEKPETYLKGLLHAKPLNYWDYIETETLLSLQKPRTNFEDEEVFIIYHQVTELMLKLMLHEIKQVTQQEHLSEAFLISKMKRINRYTEMLITSFDIMRSGMDYDDYNTFRSSLAPASGFQSVQFRHVELYCTPVINLVNEKGRTYLPKNPTVEALFENLYWKDAGRNRTTGEKTLTLRNFEDKYLDQLIALAKKTSGHTLEEKYLQLQNPSEEVTSLMKQFDYLYNVEWPLVHLNTAKHYLDAKGENQAATGGSEWKKYLHPEFQQRRFFPTLWTTEKITSWQKSEISNSTV